MGAEKLYIQFNILWVQHSDVNCEQNYEHRKTQVAELRLWSKRHVQMSDVMSICSPSCHWEYSSGRTADCRWNAPSTRLYASSYPSRPCTAPASTARPSVCMVGRTVSQVPASTTAPPTGDFGCHRKATPFQESHCWVSHSIPVSVLNINRKYLHVCLQWLW